MLVGSSCEIHLNRRISGQVNPFGILHLFRYPSLHFRNPYRTLINGKDLERKSLKQNSRALHYHLLFPTSSIAASICQESKHQKVS